MKILTFHILSMVTVGMILEVSSVASKYAHNLHNSRQTQPPQNMYPGQLGYFNGDPKYQTDYLETKTKRSRKGWIIELKKGNNQHALLCRNFRCVKIPIRHIQGLRYPKEKRGGESHKVDGRIRLL